MNAITNYLGQCSPAITPICVLSGIGGIAIPGDLIVKAVAGTVIAAIGQSECIRPLRAFGLGLVAGSAGRAVISAVNRAR